MRSQANGLRPHFSLRRIKNILLRKPPSREFAAVATLLRKDSKTNRASSFGGSGGNAADRGLYVILSASEISHRKSMEHILFTLVVGFFTSFRMTCFSTLPGVCSLGIDAKTNKKVRHIERKQNTFTCSLSIRAGRTGGRDRRG